MRIQASEPLGYVQTTRNQPFKRMKANAVIIFSPHVCRIAVRVSIHSLEHVPHAQPKYLLTKVVDMPQAALSSSAKQPQAWKRAVQAANVLHAMSCCSSDARVASSTRTSSLWGENLSRTSHSPKVAGACSLRIICASDLDQVSRLACPKGANEA